MSGQNTGRKLSKIGLTAEPLQPHAVVCENADGCSVFRVPIAMPDTIRNPIDSGDRSNQRLSPRAAKGLAGRQGFEPR